jgi:hypothetical protein
VIWLFGRVPLVIEKKNHKSAESRGYKVWVELCHDAEWSLGVGVGGPNRPLCSLQSQARLFRASVRVNLGRVGNWVKKDGNFTSPLLPFQRVIQSCQQTPLAECGAAGVQRLKISDQGHEAECLLAAVAQ